MDGYKPKIPTGKSPAALAARAIHDRNFGPVNKIIPGPNVRVSKTSSGQIINVGAPGTSASAGKLYMITQLYTADYFGAKLWSDQDESFQSEEVLVAKSITGRMPGFEVIDGQVITYDQYADNFRRAAVDLGDGPLYEYHVCHPRYMAYDEFDVINDNEYGYPTGALIVVARIPNGTGIYGPDGEHLNLIELSPARFWSFYSDQSGDGPPL